MTEQHAVEIIMQELGWRRETPEWWRSGIHTMRDENALTMCTDLNSLVDICCKNLLPISITTATLVCQDLEDVKLEVMLKTAEALREKEEV